MKSFTVHFSATLIVQAKDEEEAAKKTEDLRHTNADLQNIEVVGMDEIVPDAEDFTGATPGDR